MKLSQTISVCTRADGRPSGYDVSSFSDAGVRSNRARLSMENIILNIFLAWCSDRSTPRGTCFARARISYYLHVEVLQLRLRGGGR